MAIRRRPGRIRAPNLICVSQRIGLSAWSCRFFLPPCRYPFRRQHFRSRLRRRCLSSFGQLTAGVTNCSTPRACISISPQRRRWKRSQFHLAEWGRPGEFYDTRS